MNQNEIIEMARQAGMEFNQSLEEFSTPFCDGVYYLDLEAFAKLVAAKERERIALIGDEHPSWTGRMYAQEIRNIGEA